MYRKRTLLIPGDFPPVVSGIATYFYEIWRRLPREGNFILCARDEGWRQWDKTHDLNIVRRRIPNGNSIAAKISKGLLYAFWTWRLHQRYRFHTLHCGQVLSSGFAGWLLHRLYGVNYVIYVYGSETLRFGRSALWLKLIRTFLQEAALIVPNSKFTMAEFQALGIPAEKFRVITPGVDTQRFSPAAKDLVLMQRYGLNGKFVLLTVARLDERKGHDQVMRAVAGLKERYPQLVYLIVGKGREEERLRRLAQELSLGSKVIFTGYVPDEQLPHYYNLCDLFVLLNRQTQSDTRLQGDYEGFGIVFLEAAACGKPVIAGNFGGIADAVEADRSGFILAPDDLAAVEAKIALMSDNPSLRQVMGSYGRERAVQYFDWSIIAEKIGSILYV